MKKLLLALLLLPVVAWANPFMGDCKSQYESVYKIMMARQQGVPMHKMIDLVNKQMPEDYTIRNDTDVTNFWKAKEEIRKIIEKAYTMPNFGFMDSAAHTMAAEFANRHYLKCIRDKRK